MNQFKTLMNKEWLEHWRNFSWIWVPITFILIGIMDPITTYYLPVLLEEFGGFEEEIIFEIPAMSGADVLMMSLSEYSMFGVLIIILLTMGTIAAERQSGVSDLILVKPISTVYYILSKWLTKVIFFITSFILGMLFSWYYTNLLFDSISFSEWFWTILFYSLWLIFVITLVVFYNTLFNKQAVVAGVSVLTLIIMSIINGVFSNRMPWFPNNISALIADMLNEGQISTDLWIAFFVMIAIISSLLLLSFTTFSKNEK
ncbi:ABC-2 type transport system permease protein [Pelagirhabdus alkalitolerans]|uniref:ABC-2 type transport system permease protein n=1 Tax=Pelagirhabdus alkalitolerans TaxID=1612202 RepID=A0A1G6IGA3_9BACI|nr:ABC transporter permease [Pelagirhabdus alkalitolerans]SDC05501.1 ABC-2 type transport system permease protein [Pelagirhabdus alkalitolerans]